MILTACQLTSHNGIQLNRDGKTFNIRVTIEKEEEAWMKVRKATPPPSNFFLVNRLPGSVPTDMITCMGD